MQSPFACINLQQQIVKDINIIKYKRFLSLQVERSQSFKSLLLTSTNPEPWDVYIKKKAHLHIDNVGMIMVYNKKPFNVRFE